MNYRFWFSLLTFFFASSAMASPDTPWPVERDLIRAMQLGVKETERKTPPEPIAIRSLHSVSVGKDEEAFLVSVWFPERGRNFSAGTFLYRPKLKQARELNYTQSLGTTYLPGHFNDLLTLQSHGSGQGEEDFQHSLVRFSGWQVQVLHQVDFRNNLGNCGDVSPGERACQQTWVQFQLLAGDKPDLLDLIEVTTRVDGSLLQGKLSVTSRRLRLVGSRFKPI